MNCIVTTLSLKLMIQSKRVNHLRQTQYRKVRQLDHREFASTVNLITPLKSVQPELCIVMLLIKDGLDEKLLLFH